MEDNFYQASTERLIALPEKQTKKIQKDKLAFEKERPYMTIIMQILKREIGDREKIDSIKEQKDPVEFMREVNVNREVCRILRGILSGIETKVRMYDKKHLK